MPLLCCHARYPHIPGCADASPAVLTHVVAAVSWAVLWPWLHASAAQPQLLIEGLEQC